MQRHLTLLVIGLTITGFAAASHRSNGDAPITTQNSNVGPKQAPENPAPNATGPDQKPNTTGPVNRLQGISTAIQHAPQRVADTVLSPITELEPGKALGSFFADLHAGRFLDQRRDNETGNQTR